MLKGQSLRIKKGGAVIALATSCKISCSSSTNDVATKDDTFSGWAMPGIEKKSWTISVDKLLAPNGLQVKTDITEFSSDSLLTIEFTVGGYKFSGSAIYNQKDLQGQDKTNATSSESFTGNGKLSYVAV